jgi:hypothetical protein
VDYCNSLGWYVLMNVEQLVEWMSGKGNLKYSEESFLQYRSGHHRSHKTWPGLELGPPLWENLLQVLHCVQKTNLNRGKCCHIIPLPSAMQWHLHCHPFVARQIRSRRVLWVKVCVLTLTLARKAGARIVPLANPEASPCSIYQTQDTAQPFSACSQQLVAT